MTNLSIFIFLSAAFVVFGAFALIMRNDVISTRHTLTQRFMVAVVIGGLVGIDGNYKLGLTISIISLVAYLLKWFRFKRDQRHYCSLGMSLPECKKP